MLDSLVSNIKKQATKAMSSPAARKVLSDPRFQRAVLKAINVRADVHKTIEGRVQGFATSYNLVTRSDVAKLRRTIRELETTVANLKKQLEKQAAATVAASGAAAPEAATEGAEERPTRRRPQRREEA